MTPLLCTRLDHRAARARRDQAIGPHCCALPAPEARTATGADPPLPGDEAAGFLRSGECLGDEGPGALRLSRSDAARADAEFALVAHGQNPTHRASLTKLDTTCERNDNNHASRA